MKIRITEEHIRKGFRGSCASDAICLALRDAGLVKPWASPSQIQFRLGHKDYCLDTPEELVEFMMAYDNNLTVREMEFELEGV